MTGSFPVADHLRCLASASSAILTNTPLLVTAFWHRTQEMTPKLQAVYGVKGDWQQVIAAAMQLPPKMPDTIRGLWAKNTETAHNNQVTLTPQQFAEMLVDQNLAG
jgi:hypothetical protein